MERMASGSSSASAELADARTIPLSPVTDKVLARVASCQAPGGRRLRETTYGVSAPPLRASLPRVALWWRGGASFCASCCAKRSPLLLHRIASSCTESRSALPSDKDNGGRVETVPAAH